MTKPDPEEARRRKEHLETLRREAEEIFERQGAKIAARRQAEEVRQERKRKLLRLLTFGRAA